METITRCKTRENFQFLIFVPHERFEVIVTPRYFTSELAAIGMPMDDEMKACVLLIGLPASLSPVKMTMESADELKHESVLEKLNAMGDKEKMEKASGRPFQPKRTP